MCEYEAIQEPKSVESRSVGSFGGAVLDLEVNVSSTKSSSSASGVSARGSKRTSEVLNELELLKRKISILEKSVSLSHKIEEELFQHQSQPFNRSLQTARLRQNISSLVSLHKTHNIPNLVGQSMSGSFIHKQQFLPRHDVSTFRPGLPYWPSFDSSSKGSHSSLSGSDGSETTPLWKASPDDPLFLLRDRNPFPPDMAVFSFNNGYVPFMCAGNITARYLPPLCWVSLVRLDPAISPIFWYKKGSLQTRIKNEKPVQPSDKVFQDKFLLANVDKVKYENPKRKHFNTEKSEIVKRFNESAMLVGLTVFDGEIDPNVDIASKVRLLLPTRKVVWLLIDLFFERLYPYYPLLDQFDFEEQVIALLGFRDEDDAEVTQLDITTKMDVITCGILLLVLRLAYLSVITNNTAVNEAIFKGTDESEEGRKRTFLIHNPIHIDVIDIAQQCLHCFGYLRYCNIQILQLSVFIQVYQCYAPENGEGYDDITVKGHTAMLINMAMSLGLHREPNNFSIGMRDLRMKNLSRKIWWYLVILDSHATISSGVPLSTRRLQFDTAPPFYTEGCSNVKDDDLEKTVIGLLAKFNKKFDDVAIMSDLVANVEPLVSVAELSNALSRLEAPLIANYSGELEFNPSASASVSSSVYEEVVRSIRIKIHFQSLIFLLSLSFHFFCYFEKVGNIDFAYYYMKKMVYFTVTKMSSFYNSFVENSYSFFEKTSDIPIVPTFQALVHKCMIFLQSILIRSRFSILQCETSSSHAMLLANNPHYKKRYELLRETWNLTENCLQVFVSHTTKMGSRFYYSWRCSKAQMVLKEIHQGTDYYLNYRKGNESYMLFTNTMLEDLNSLLRQSLDFLFEKKTSSYESDSGMYVDEDTRILSTMPVSDLSSPFDENHLWNQMVMVKPRVDEAMKNHLTPHTVNFSMQTDLNDASTGYTNDVFFPEQTFQGLNFFDSLFDDLSKPDL